MFWSIAISNTLRPLRTALAGIVYLLNAIVLIITLAALARGNGGSAEAVAVGLNFLALISAVLFKVHMITQPEMTWERKRHIFVFAALSGLGLVLAVMFSVRAKGGGLSADYISLGDLGTLLLVLTWFSFVFAMAGLAITLFGFRHMETPKQPAIPLAHQQRWIEINEPSRQVSGNPIFGSSQLLREGKFPNGQPFKNIEKWPVVPLDT